MYYFLSDTDHSLVASLIRSPSKPPHVSPCRPTGIHLSGLVITLPALTIEAAYNQIPVQTRPFVDRNSAQFLRVLCTLTVPQQNPTDVMSLEVIPVRPTWFMKKAASSNDIRPATSSTSSQVLDFLLGDWIDFRYDGIYFQRIRAASTPVLKYMPIILLRNLRTQDGLLQWGALDMQVITSPSYCG
ncbi:hypothetical protein B0O80DRAFT_502173 [Mortierella sp. GBAus27b]|nr:hypothetical protein B0O80DRAFT_502173 [Mortierella sp. GBAus27b]